MATTGTFLTFNPANKDGAKLDYITEQQSSDLNSSLSAKVKSVVATTLSASDTSVCVNDECVVANCAENKKTSSSSLNDRTSTKTEDGSKANVADVDESFIGVHSGGSSDASSNALPLQYCWHIWEQIIPDSKSAKSRIGNYSENTKQLAKFDTVQKFWQLWYHMPQPSELLNHKRMVREGQDGKQHLVDALMIFRDGIKPEWEDPMNANGGHFEYKLRQGQITSGSQVDEYWNNLVLGLVGSTIDCNHLITGVRLVDKLSNVRMGSIRLEVWFTECKSEKTLNDLWKSVDRCIATKLDGSLGNIPKSDMRWHSDRLDTRD